MLHVVAAWGKIGKSICTYDPHSFSMTVFERDAIMEGKTQNKSSDGSERERLQQAGAYCGLEAALR